LGTVIPEQHHTHTHGFMVTDALLLLNVYIVITQYIGSLKH